MIVSNSALRARIDRLPPSARRAARAVLGPALDLPDDAKPREALLRTLRQAHLFAPVHAVLFAALGAALIRVVPVSAACDPGMAGLGRLTLLFFYEIGGVPLLTLAAAFAVRRRFRDPYTRHASRVALVLLTATFALVAWSAASSFLSMDARVRRVSLEVLRCAY